MNDLVTIGIPFYNAQSYLETAIRSVINQSYKNWELLLIDDGSTDNSLLIAKSFNDNRIKVISDGKNLGLAIRLNQISYLANGKYCARMDADDIMLFSRLEQQILFLISNPSCDLVGSSFYFIDSDNKVLGLRIMNEKPFNRSHVINGSCFCHPSITGKTEWFRKHPYNEKLRKMQDCDLWLREVERSTFMNIKEPLIYYRVDYKYNNKKYQETQKFWRNYIIENQKIFKEKTITAYVNSLIKSTIYNTLNKVNKTDLIIKRRYQSIDRNDLINAQLFLSKSIK